MFVSLDILDAKAPLAELEAALQQTEADLRFDVLSLAVGTVDGRRASIVTFKHRDTGDPPRPLSLQIIDGTLSKQEQETALNALGKTIACYGSLLVQGRQQNVAALR